MAMRQTARAEQGGVLVATALPVEKRALVAALAEEDLKPLVEVIGCGPAAVEKRLPPLLARLKPAALFFIGAAGWLGESIQFEIGSAWLVEDALWRENHPEDVALEQRGSALPCSSADGPLLRQAQGITQLPSATCVTVEAPVTDEQTRAQLVQAATASLVDMETYFVYRLAAERGISALAVRIVTDFADERAVTEFETNLEQAFRRNARAIGKLVSLTP